MNKFYNMILVCLVVFSVSFAISNNKVKAATDDWPYTTDMHTLTHNANYSTYDDMNIKNSYRVKDKLDFFFTVDSDYIVNMPILKVYKINNDKTLTRCKTLKLDTIKHKKLGVILVTSNYRIEKGFSTGKYVFVLKVNNDLFYHSDNITITK